MQVNPWDVALTPLQIDPRTGKPRVQVQAPTASPEAQRAREILESAERSRQIPFIGNYLAAADMSLLPREHTTGLENIFLDPFRAAGAWAKDVQTDLGKTADYLTSTPTELAQRQVRAARTQPVSAAPGGSPFGGGGAQQQSQLSGDWMESRITSAIPGVNVSSRGRTAERNRQVGGVPNSYHLYERGALARDYTPPKGMSMGQLYSSVRATLGPEWRVINEGDHVHVEPSGGQRSAAGGPGGLANPFDAAAPYFKQALAGLNAAEQAALTPFSTTMDVGEAPAIPDPILAPKTDWSAADAALEKLRPEEMSEKERMAISREGWLNGIGQALMRVPDGAGLGQVLAMVGGGALAGRQAGNAEVRARMDRFEEKMARYNVALAEREVLKASTAQKEAAQEVATLNAFAQAKWKVAYDQWSSESQPTISGSNIISSKTVDGKKTIQVTPIAPMVRAAFAADRAQMLAQIGGAAQQGAGMVAQANNAFVMAQAAANISQVQDQNAAIAAGPIMQATAAVRAGYGPDIVGADEYDALTKEAGRRAMQGGFTPGTEEYTESVQMYIAAELSRAALMGNKTVLERLGSYGAVGSAVSSARSTMDAKRSVRTGPKGSTTTTTYPGGN